MAFGDKELGLGVVNPRTEQVESCDTVRRSIERALLHYPAERLFLNPDCGFGTFSGRPMNSQAIAAQKLRAIAAAARDLRG
jgi:5-methyltetrahydropteroyltriglutamate--homocysteine methyltransferase